MSKRGVFWIVEGKLLAFLFDETATEGIAKSGKTFNHKLLWESVKPCNKPYDYFPRGRVDLSAKGEAVIYMSPHIGEEHLAGIKAAFEITTNPVIRYDHSEHYRCYLDR